MRKEKLILIFALFCGFIPYVTILFFHRSLGFMILLPLYFFSLVAIIGFSVWCVVITKGMWTRIFIGLFPIIAISMFIGFFGSLMDLGDQIFVKFREERLNEFVTEINKYGKIVEMSDGERYWKTINNISIEPLLSSVDSTSEIAKKFYLNDVLSENQISIDVYENFRKRLIDVDLISFDLDENGIIYFTIDGFQGDCVGVAYCNKNIQPKYNFTGRVSKWIKVSDNWYVWYTG